MSKGTNKQPSLQYYKVYPSAIMTKRIKKSTEKYKSYKEIYDRLKPEQKSMLAYFAEQMESSSREQKE